MRVGVDYRFLSSGRYQATRGMGRFTQQQLREVLRRDRSSEYVVCCPPGADTSLVDPEIRAAPNASLELLPEAVTERGDGPGDDTLERAELLQDWVERRRLDIFHLTTPMLPSEPVLANFDVCPLVATLYDLIPLVFPDRYLGDAGERDRYLRGVSLLAKASRLIAISASARHDALYYLGIPTDRVDVAYPVADPAFAPAPVPGLAAGTTLRHLPVGHRVGGRFVMAVTHLHHSKNAELLLSGYSMVPSGLRRQLPLVLCCQLDQGTAARLRAITDVLGITDEVVVTGMVSDHELAALYRRATMLVHPSRYEGFGLPVLEAMRCGTPVVTTTASSLPEVAGGAARLVDPDAPASLAEAIAELAADGELRDEMRRRGLASAERFSADQLGATTLDTYRTAVSRPAATGERRLRLAMWTPVPPQQSGIADYSAELVEELSASCSLELFVDGGFTPDLEVVQRHPVHHFSAFARRQRLEPFDVVVYQMGNSHFHLFMYDAIHRHPGVVVLHDMAWSQVLYGQLLQRGGMEAFLSELASTEGDDAVREFAGFDRLRPAPRDRLRLQFLDRHPMLGGLVERSLAQIVHFDACRDELVARYRGARPRVVEMGVADPYGRRPHVEVGIARAELRLSPETFVIGTFGIVHPVKRVETCLRAVARLLPSTPELVLLVVGRMAGVEYEAHLRGLAAELGVERQVRFTGHVSKEEFEAHLIASDVVVNLRTPTHEHMSAVIARAIAAAKPVVISDLPGWTFLSEQCFVRIPVDDDEVDTLTDALRRLAGDPLLRERLGRSARARFVARGSSREMARGYLRVLDEIGDDAGRAGRGLRADRSPDPCLARRA